MKHLITLLCIAGVFNLNAQVTHTIYIMDNVFSPATLTIEVGDNVHLIWDDVDHSFTQVDQSTWLANGTTPLGGGYNYGYGTVTPGTDFTITPMALGVIYYVCQQHVDMGMKGTIAVEDNTGVEEAGTMSWLLAPNPVADHLQIIGTTRVPVELWFFDATGQLALTTTPDGGGDVDVASLANGIYTVSVRDRDQRRLAEQRVVVSH